MRQARHMVEVSLPRKCCLTVPEPQWTAGKVTSDLSRKALNVERNIAVSLLFKISMGANRLQLWTSLCSQQINRAGFHRDDINQKFIILVCSIN